LGNREKIGFPQKGHLLCGFSKIGKGYNQKIYGFSDFLKNHVLCSFCMEINFSSKIHQNIDNICSPLQFTLIPDIIHG
jgi:hypothetical protein